MAPSPLATLFLAFAAAAQVVRADCIESDPGLKWLSSRISSEGAIACLGEPLQQYNADRYWASQAGKDASVVVFPVTTEDVSHAVRAALRSPLGEDFAFVGGGHGQTNASSAYGFVVDLSWMNSTSLVEDFQKDDGSTVVAVEYQGGANWGQVQEDLAGSGYTPIGARVSTVGAGGFSTGGGIGFLAGAHGFAIDKLLQMEVVLPSGQIVTATKTNKYSDLFWALQGGGGQFGIVTRFWQEAVPEPTGGIAVGCYYIKDEDVPRARENLVKWFDANEDPYSVVYFSFGYLTEQLVPNPPPDSYARRTLLFILQFPDPDNPKQPSFKDSFAGLLEGLDTSQGSEIPVQRYADLVELGAVSFPYGWRRGFYGGQTSTITVKYLEQLTDAYDAYSEELTKRGEDIRTSAYVVQYMYPGLNGNLPASDSDTAWPHSVSGHQTLFSPAYKDAANDGITIETALELNRITDRTQVIKNGKLLANYPNYALPEEGNWRVFGSNLGRLMRIKQKYDPRCLIRRGMVIPSPSCILGGWAKAN